MIEYDEQGFIISPGVHDFELKNVSFLESSVEMQIESGDGLSKYEIYLIDVESIIIKSEHIQNVIYSIFFGDADLCKSNTLICADRIELSGHKKNNKIFIIVPASGISVQASCFSIEIK